MKLPFSSPLARPFASSVAIPVLGISVLLAGCERQTPPPPSEEGRPSTQSQAQAQAENPFFSPSTLPFEMPPFDQITTGHFEPAMERGMQLQLEEIEAIVANAEAPTFENTVVAMEQSGQDLTRVLRVFYNLTSAHTNDSLQAIERDMAPRLAEHDDAISLNPRLFARLQQVYDQRESLGLDDEAAYLLERYYKDFVRAGALLSPDQQERLKEINAELAKLSTQFDQHVLAERNDSAVVIGTRDELAGLTQAEIEAAAHEATARGFAGQYVITILNTSGQPPLTNLSNRDVRERIMRASLARGSRGNEFDTTGIVSDVLKLRAERARMLGFRTHADYILDDQTAGSVEAVNRMLSDLTPVAVANAREEGREITNLIGQIESEPFEVQAWDWAYYSEQVRQQRYSFEEAEVKPYFELNNVLVNGVFYAAGQVFGLSFSRREDLPVYHPDVQVWEVTEADGTSLGIMLADFYLRPSKRGGAWMNSYNVQSGLLGGTKVIAMHQNITKPSVGDPTLLTFDEVTTMFHEFGHVLHGFFSDVEYPRFAGTRVPRDFVEFPSQVNEMWATWPEVLENYALHHETGERIPQELLDRVLEAEQFNQGFATTEYLAASVIDQSLHQLTEDEIPDAGQIMDFEAQVLRNYGFDYEPVPPRYRTPYFSHIMGGYSAGYYSYIWSEVLDADSVQWFHENGGMSRETGSHFRDALLSRGGSRDAMQLYRDFAGRDPDISHMLRRRGLL